MSVIDSHCHLDAAQFDEDREAVIQRAIDAGVSKFLCIGTGDGPPDLESAIRLADSHSCVFATAGIHPEHAPNATDADFKRLAELLRHPKCVGAGEIGLDYHWQPYNAEIQAAVFVAQLHIAGEAGKPVIIHTRDAWADTMSLLMQHWQPTGLPCIMHCFTGSPEEAHEALGSGFFLSFSGV
ncbi:MAG: TatD family hydrolase, partial [Bryobacteraceae bacterium]|nr:TatD family hydrolase [Bryobacteraceae bacterium]